MGLFTIFAIVRRLKALHIMKDNKANIGPRTIFDKIIEDKKAIVKSIREGERKEIIEEKRDVRFATPV